MDEALIPLVTSVNIACGFHAGDYDVMRRTVYQALRAGVAVGAHPAFPDLQGFGRRELTMSAQSIENMVLYQLGALDAFLRAEGGVLHHVKPHGALYNLAARDESVARAVVSAVHLFNPQGILYAPPDSALTTAAEALHVHVAREAFVDRRYVGDGQLAPRTVAGAIIQQPEEAGAHAIAIVCSGQAATVAGGAIPMRADTLCIHGDHPRAVQVALHVRSRLLSAGVDLRACTVT